MFSLFTFQVVVCLYSNSPLAMDYLKSPWLPILIGSRRQWSEGHCWICVARGRYVNNIYCYTGLLICSAIIIPWLCNTIFIPHLMMYILCSYFCNYLLINCLSTIFSGSVIEGYGISRILKQQPSLLWRYETQHSDPIKAGLQS